jgi:type I restriction-modification system DNA methylase subunit
MQPNATIIKPLERISNTTGHGLGEVFKTFLTFAFCILSVGQREEMYLEEAKRWKREQLKVFGEAFHALHTEMEKHPYQDLLGDIHMQILSPKSKQYSGEYYTPHNVCLMTAKMMLSDTDKIIKILEPACGSGRMILACAAVYANDFNRSPTRLRVQAWDTSRTAVMMTHINTTLWGIPCWILHGDTLRMKVHAEYPNLFTTLYPWPREDAPEQTKSEEPRAERVNTITLGKGHEQTSLFELDEAA